MITFKQFYNEFLIEAKYHSMHNVHAPSYAIMHEGGRGSRGHYIMQDDMFNPQLQGAVGYIITNPKSREFLDDSLRSQRIKAAMGVFSNDQKNDAGQKTTDSKMFAFHLAKYKLEAPGALVDNADDLAFYNSTIDATAKLLRDHIATLNGGTYSIVQPFSTMEFNQAVIDRVIPNNAATTVDKKTFIEANRIWSSSAGRQRSILKYSIANERHRFIEGALRLLNHLLNSGEGEDIALLQLINYKPRQQLIPERDKVSLERLAYIIMQISCRHALKKRGAELGYIDANYRWGADLRDDEQAEDEQAEDEQAEDEQAKGKKCNDRKSYYLSHLKPVYFKDLQGQLNNNVIVVDDNINSGATYKAVNEKIRERNNQASITWVVGIIPIIKESEWVRAVRNAPAAQPVAQAPAAQVLTPQEKEAKKRQEKIDELVKLINNFLKSRKQTALDVKKYEVKEIEDAIAAAKVGEKVKQNATAGTITMRSS